MRQQGCRTGRHRRQFECPTCEVRAGTTCRTRGGKVAPKRHTPRFMLVPQRRAAKLGARSPRFTVPADAWTAFVAYASREA